MALIYTPGGASDNSYVTLAEAESYFDDRIGSNDNGDWEKDSAGVARTDAVKSAALVTATRRLDEETFLGLKTTSGQALKWPRSGAFDEDGNEFDSATIPRRVKEATYLVALELLKTNFLNEDYLNNFSFFSTGTLQFKQFTQQGAGRLPAEAVRLLRIVMTSAGGGRIVRA